MKLTSPAFDHNGLIPSEYTCDGENVSPPLTIEGPLPIGTESLALICDDPDAPKGTWVHWIVWNISPEANDILENEVPAGAMEGVTSFGTTGYGGPCPPSGVHRYFFKLYALDKILEMTDEADKALLETTMEGHILEKAELMGKYERH